MKFKRLKAEIEKEGCLKNEYSSEAIMFGDA